MSDVPAQRRRQSTAGRRISCPIFGQRVLVWGPWPFSGAYGYALELQRLARRRYLGMMWAM